MALSFLLPPHPGSPFSRVHPLLPSSKKAHLAEGPVHLPWMILIPPQSCQGRGSHSAAIRKPDMLSDFMSSLSQSAKSTEMGSWHDSIFPRHSDIPPRLATAFQRDGTQDCQDMEREKERPEKMLQGGTVGSDDSLL